MTQQRGEPNQMAAALADAHAAYLKAMDADENLPPNDASDRRCLAAAIAVYIAAILQRDAREAVKLHIAEVGTTPDYLDAAHYRRQAIEGADLLEASALRLAQVEQERDNLVDDNRELEIANNEYAAHSRIERRWFEERLAQARADALEEAAKYLEWRGAGLVSTIETARLNDLAASIRLLSATASPPDFKTRPAKREPLTGEMLEPCDPMIEPASPPEGQTK